MRVLRPVVLFKGSDTVILIWILSNNRSLSFDFIIFEMGYNCLLRDLLKIRNNSKKYLAYSKHGNGFLLSSLEMLLCLDMKCPLQAHV